MYICVHVYVFTSYFCLNRWIILFIYWEMNSLVFASVTWLCIRHMHTHHISLLTTVECRNVIKTWNDNTWCVLPEYCNEFTHTHKNTNRTVGNILFNDTLSTFYLWLYGRKEVFYLMTHSPYFILWRQTYGKRTTQIAREENPLPPHGLFFLISSKGFLYMHHPTYRITHNSLCYTSRGALAGAGNSSLCPL